MANSSGDRAQRLLALHTVALAIGGQRDSQSTLELILDQACQLIGAPAGTVYVWDEMSQALRCRVWRNVPVDYPSKPVHSGEGSAGEAFRTREAVIVNQYRGWEGASATGKSSLVAAALSVPLRMGERPLGVLTVHTYETGRLFTEEDAWLLGLLGDQAAKALEQARLVEEAETRSRRLLALHRISTTIATDVEPQGALCLIVRSAVELLGRSGSAIYLWDEDEKVLRLAESAGLEDYPSDVTLRPGEGLVGQIWVTNEPLVVQDYANWQHAHPDGIRAGNGAIAGFPLVAGGRSVGVLWVRNRGEGPVFNDEDLRIVELLANQAAVAVERARLFEQAARARALEELARLKNEFVSAVSHELRTPLTFVHGYAELINARDMGREETRAMAREIFDASGRMRRLLDDLLDFGRLESGRFQLRHQSIQLGDLVRRAVANALFRTPAREIVAEVEDLPEVPADPDRIGQVLDNLIQNAQNYAPNGPIVVRLVSRQDRARIEVVDCGPGVPLRDQTRIFEPFYRGERSEIATVRGGGLGLSIVRRLVESHGGVIGLQSTPGHGSTFWFTLPLGHPTRDGVAADYLREVQAGQPS